jgi:hypothetical protein
MNVVYATGSTQVTTPDGGRYNVRRGEYWPADDPVVKAAKPGVFSADPLMGGLRTHNGRPPEAPVEQATAGPGEKRTTRRG